MRIGLVSCSLGLLLLVIGVESVGRVATERLAEGQLRRNGIAGGVEIDLGRDWWRPTILSAALTSGLDRVSVHLTDAELYSMPVLDADYVLDGLGIDASLWDRTISANSIDSGSVRVLVDPAAIGKVFATRAVVQDGRLLIGPDREPAELRVVGGELVLRGLASTSGGQTTSMRVVDPQLLPCAPQVRLLEKLVELSCRGDRLPGILERPMGLTGGAGSVAPPTELEAPLTITAPDGSGSSSTTPKAAPGSAAASTAPTPPGGNDGG